MADTVYLAYYINLPDKELVQTLQGNPGEGGAVGATIEAPYNPGPPMGGAAVAYGQQLSPPVVPLPVIKNGEPFQPASLTSPWFGSEYNFPLNVREFTRKSGGWFGISWLFGKTTKFYWRGHFVYSAENTSAPVGGDEPAQIPVRHWADGAELPIAGEGGTSAGGAGVSRGASRTVEGYGYAFRGWSNYYKQHTEASGSYHTWERIYLCLRNPDPVQSVNFWRVNLTTATLAGLMFDITANREIAVYNRSNTGSEILISTAGQLELNEWTKCDILLDFNDGANPARVRVYLNGVLKADIGIGSASGGFGTAGAHNSSYFGNNRSQANNLELDADDWIAHGIPRYTDFGTIDEERLNSLDWLNGSHVILMRPTGEGTGWADWTGHWGNLMANPVGGSETYLTSTVSAARMEVDTDSDWVLEALEGGIGIASMNVAKYGNRGGTANGTLGWAFNVGGDDLDTITEAGTVLWNTRLWSVNGLSQVLPDWADITPVKLVHVKGASTDLATVWALMGAVEVVGIFGKEDTNDADALNGREFVRDPHNAPYPESQWVRSPFTTLAPLLITSGTYTGDDIGDVIELALQANWGWIRPLTGNLGGVQWWTSMVASHRSLTEALRPQAVIRARLDPNFAGATAEDEQEQQTLIRRAGDQAQSNADTITYQYVFFCDPWRRNLICGACSHKSGAGASNNPLIDPTFLPDAVWGALEEISTSTTVGIFYKGPGHATDAAQIVNTAVSADALTLEAGNLVTRDDLHVAGIASMAYAAWRKNDGSEDDNAEAYLRIGSYTGNGSGSRTIGMTPSSGRRPLWGAIGPTTGTFYVRDPSHGGSDSSPITGGATVATAIMGGGVDEFTVGSTLNANGVVYNYFIIMGCTDAGNNGWSDQCDWWPVDPTNIPPGGGWPTEPPEPPTFPPTIPPEPTVPPEIPPELPPEINGDCAAYTQELCNMALGRIGHSREIEDIALETSEEAYLSRRFYMQVIKQVLRDHPWPFATRHATLTLVGGSESVPYNADWTYAYRQPANCLFERRLVVDREGAVDPTPPPFQLGSDAEYDEEDYTHTGGNLIFTHEADAVLEYTCWPTCPARFGDPLFKEAAIWKLAANLAPALSRDTQKAAWCEERYQGVIRKAWDVLRPGNPGARPAAPASDPDDGTGAAAANVALVNRALVRIGARTIANLTTEQSREAVAAAMVFEEELRTCLRDFPWAFATQYAELALVEGTTEAPVNADWTYSYRVPTDCVFARRVVREGTGRAFDAEPPPFRLGRDATGMLLFSNYAAWDDETDPATQYVTLEYTKRIDDLVLSCNDPLFRDAFAWRLAATLAPSLAQVEPETTPEQLGRGAIEPNEPRPRKPQLALFRRQAAEAAWRMYWLTIERARVGDANEQQQEKFGDAEWISGRD